MPAVQLGIGAALALLSWAGLRWNAGARLTGPPATLALDALAPLLGFGIALAGTARPIFAGLAILAPAIGLAIADRLKRRILDEPVVFADRSELHEVVRHPRLYLAFIGTGRMVAGALLCLAVIAGFVWLEPPLWRVEGWMTLLAPIAAIVAARACFVIPGLPPIRAWLARRYAALGASRDPAIDSARLGPLATLMVHATIAGAERRERQAAVAARMLPPCPSDAGPILLVQGESFLDPRHLHPGFASLVPHFARLADEASCRGRFDVPCWGANTIRTEIAVLTGTPLAALGLDRFNPYAAFARTGLPSIAAAARDAGYHTVCVHPYHATFYARHRVMPLLGFDRFVGLDAFEAPRDGLYVSDVAVAEMIARLLDTHGRKLFVFAITMENHGPWDGVGDRLPPALPPEDRRGVAQADALGRWLARLARTDAMLPVLEAALAKAGGGWLGFYGDHQPSLAGAFAGFGMADRRTDYLVWRGGGGGVRRDIAAHDLAALMLQAMAA